MFVKTGLIRKKLRNFCFLVFNWLENNNNPDPHTNGEYNFIINLFKFYSHSNTDILIFDVGANKGEYTEFMLKMAIKENLNVKIHIFEPQKRCIEILSRKFGNNKSIWINNFGLSDTESFTDIFYNEEGSGLASIYKRKLDHYGIKMDTKERIKLIRADKYIEEKGITKIHFLKIDVEGHELAVLKGFGEYLDSRFIDFIQFEYGGASADANVTLLSLYKLLESRNFTVAKIMRGGIEVRKYQPFMENFQYSNYVAISSEVINQYANFHS